MHQSDSTRRSGNVRAILRRPDFRRLLGVRLVSQFADGLFQAGLAGNLLFSPERKASALAVASGFAILLLPYSLIGPYVGVFLDRWYRRSVLYLANLIRALLVLPVALLVWRDASNVAFALFALGVIALNRFFLSGLSAAQPHVVDAERLVTANALSSTLGTVLYSAGLGVLGLGTALGVLPAGPPGYALMAMGGSAGYLLSALGARASFRRGQLGPDEGERHAGSLRAALVTVSRGMIAGLRHLASRRDAAYTVLAQGGYRALYGVLAMTTLVLYRRYFYPHSADAALAGLAEIVVAGAAGSLLAAFITPPLSRLLGAWRWITGLFCGVGIVVLALGLRFQPGALIAAVFLINVGSQGTKIVVDTTVQRRCDDVFRGRVFSVNDTLYNALFVAGLYVAAVLLPGNGRSPVIVAAVGVGFELLAAWYGLAAARQQTRQAADRAERPRLPVG